MTDILMPKLSDTMEEGKIIRWLKQRGDRIAIGDVLAEVETDKADMELEAFDEGVLAEIKTPEGGSAPVGAVIAVLGDATADVAAASPRVAGDGGQAAGGQASDAASGEAEEAGTGEPPPAQPPPRAAQPPARPAAAAQPAEPPRVRASPLARKRADEAGVDLEAVRGTGPGGRIVERDVEAVAKAGPAREQKGPARVRPVAAAKPTGAPRGATPAPGGDDAAVTRVELSKVRRTTARRMADAKRDVPHFYASSDVAMDECVRLKEGLAALEGEYSGITYTHLVLKAVGLALRRVPEMNASLDGETVVLHQTVHVGLATATDDGLLVPVVRDCDRQPLGALVTQVRALVERARAGKFAADDLRGGTFTVSNLGMYPVSHFAAVVNPPQAAILAVGAVREVPVVRGGEVVPGHLMTVTLSCDHRVVDGALAGRFLKEVSALLGAPLALVA